MNIEIRKAVVQDVPEMLRIRAQGWLDHYPNEDYGVTRDDILNENLESSEAAQKRIDAITDPNSTLKTWVAEINAKVIGYLTVNELEEYNVLSGIYVDSTHQKEGIGAKLYDEAINHLGRMKDIYLEVIPYNEPAVRFYTKRGFVKTDKHITREQVELKNGKTLPLISMVLPAS